MSLHQEEAFPYASLADIYDRVMAHVDYSRWVNLIQQINKKYGVPNRDILELGGGTGKLAALFPKGNWNWICSDLSLGMITKAKRSLNGGRQKVMVQDARRPALRKDFGLVLFLYDGINYFLEMNDFRLCFQNVKEILAKKGLFLFDITTKANSVRHFSDETYFEDLGGACFVRHSYFDSLNSIQHNQFNIFQKGENGEYQRMIENHRQRIVDPARIKMLLKDLRFDILGVWDGYTFNRARSSSSRVHFLVRKP